MHKDIPLPPYFVFPFSCHRFLPLSLMFVPFFKFSLELVWCSQASQVRMLGGNPFAWLVGLCLSYAMATLTSDGQTDALMAGRTDGQAEG